MCQLLAMTSKNPADIRFSLTGFRRRGGLTDDHIDGFGIAYFQPTGLRLYYDDQSAMASPIAEMVSAMTIKANHTLVHIRKSDDSLLKNAHPFVRELWGEPWVFMHNGKRTIADMPDNDPIKQQANQHSTRYYQPIGDTDSEYAFCYLLNQLKDNFTQKPDSATLNAFLTTQCRFLSTYGIFNCLLCNGDWLLAYANTLLFYVTRQAPFAQATLIDADVTMDFAQTNHDDDVITVLATTPLTSDEHWQQLAVNECLIFQNGQIIHQDLPKPAIHLSIKTGLEIAKSA